MPPVLLVVLTVHTIIAKSEGVANPGQDNIAIPAAWLGVAFEWLVVDRFGISLFPALHYFFVRPEFVIDGIGLVHRPEVVAGVIKLGAFFVF